VAHWIYRWVIEDLWYPLWPNLAASLVVYVFVWLKLRAMQEMHRELKDLHNRHHAEHMEAISRIPAASE
jgi:hypothetical protein